MKHRWNTTQLKALDALARMGKSRQEAADILGIDVKCVRYAAARYDMPFPRFPQRSNLRWFPPPLDLHGCRP
jgi:hypothetical protein